LKEEALRESITREKLRESLLSSRRSMRNSELKYSAYKSTADKTWVDPRELSPRNHAKMVINFEDSIFDNKCLEDKRTNLALRYDFCLTELFAMIDYAKTGLLSLSFGKDL